MTTRWAAPLVAALVTERLAPMRALESGGFDIDDPEAVHDLRVGARRLHAALTVSAPLAQFPAGVRRRALRRVERRLGGLRDLDVLLELAAELPADAPLVPDLLAELAAGRRDARERGRSALERRGLRRTLEGLEQWVRQPRFTPLASQPFDGLVPDLLAPALATVFLHPSWLAPELPDPDSPTAAGPHDLRRRVKALRYRLECVAPTGENPLTAWVGELREIQRGLGVFHDVGVLLTRVPAELAGSPAVEPVRTRAALAVAAWPEWRGRYLDPEFRTAARTWLEPAPAFTPLS